MTKHLLQSSLAPATRHAYKLYWLRFCKFQSTHNNLSHETMPANTNHIASFVSYLFLKQFSTSTILSHLSAIAFFHQCKGFPDPTSHYIIRRMILGCKKSRPSSDARLPILLPTLHKLVDSCHTNLQHSYFKKCLFSSIYLTAFHGFFRIGELLPNTLKQSHHVVNFHDISISRSAAAITLRHYKTQTSSNPVTIFIKRTPSYCPVSALESFIKLRGSMAGPLFLDSLGNPILMSAFRRQFSDSLRFCKLSPVHYKPHSFRIGACTQATMLGVPDDKIKQMGRWRSNAYRRYIRLPSLTQQ